MIFVSYMMIDSFGDGHSCNIDAWHARRLDSLYLRAITSGSQSGSFFSLIFRSASNDISLATIGSTSRQAATAFRRLSCFSTLIPHLRFHSRHSPVCKESVALYPLNPLTHFQQCLRQPDVRGAHAQIRPQESRRFYTKVQDQLPTLDSHHDAAHPRGGRKVSGEGGSELDTDDHCWGRLYSGRRDEEDWPSVQELDYEANKRVWFD